MHVYCSLQTNTFQAVIATGTTNGQTKSYVIFLYCELGWLDKNAAIGVLDGHGHPLFVLGLTQYIIKEVLQAPPSGVLVADLDKYWYNESITAEAAESQGDTSKLSEYSDNLRKPLEVLQESIDLYLK